MNVTSGGSGISYSLTPSGSSTSTSSTSHPYVPSKRNYNSQSSPTFSPHDLRELTQTLQELNLQFKRNVQVPTDIKDCIFKVCEKPETRPVDDNSGVHKLERVSSVYFPFLFFSI